MASHHFKYVNVLVCIKLKPTIVNRLYLPLYVTIIILSTGCLPNQMLTRSGALNTISIDLNDENVTYQQLSNSFEIGSRAGFLDTKRDGNFKSRTSTVINNNGMQTRTAVTGQASLLKVLSMIASTLLLSANDFEALIVPSLLASVPLNEVLWRPFNRKQVQGITMNRLIDNNPDAHFYSFPNSNISETARLIRTSWEGENYIVAGTISNQLVQGAGNVSSQGSYGDRDRTHQSSAAETHQQMRESKVTVGAASFDLSTVKEGTSGIYEISKNESLYFIVIEIQEESDDDKIIRIEYTGSRGEKKQKLTKASNPRLKFFDQ